MSEESKKREIFHEEQLTAGQEALIARELQKELKRKLSGLLADPRTPRSFRDAFKNK